MSSVPSLSDPIPVIVECGMCLYNLLAKEINVTPCGHAFHRDCLHLWWNRRPAFFMNPVSILVSCPTCRTPCRKTDAVKVYLGESTDSEAMINKEWQKLKKEAASARASLSKAEDALKEKDKAIQEFRRQSTSLRNRLTQEQEERSKTISELKSLKILTNEQQAQIRANLDKIASLEKLEKMVREELETHRKIIQKLRRETYANKAVGAVGSSMTTPQDTRKEDPPKAVAKKIIPSSASSAMLAPNGRSVAGAIPNAAIKKAFGTSTRRSPIMLRSSLKRAADGGTAPSAQASKSGVPPLRKARAVLDPLCLAPKKPAGGR